MSTTEFRRTYCDPLLDIKNAKTDEAGQAVHEDCYVAKSASAAEKSNDGADRSEGVP